jgi:hypothetical protein
MPERRRLRPAAGLITAMTVLAVAPALTACGVGASGPTRLAGGAYHAGQVQQVDEPPRPNATNPQGLVQDFLDATVGGGAAAVKNALAFFDENGKTHWPAAQDKQPPTAITVIRILDLSPTKNIATSAFEVTVTYQEVGQLVDGRLSTPVAPGPDRSMKFFVVSSGNPSTLGAVTESASGPLRIDKITSDGLGSTPELMLDANALHDVYYHPQPIYFWDYGNTVLLPDVRYVPKTITTDAAANLVLQWLTQHPSQPLVMAPLPTGSVVSAVSSQGSTMSVKMSAQAGGQGKDDQRRLVYQVQASLQPLGVNNVQVTVGTTSLVTANQADYEKFELSTTLPHTPEEYDIQGGAVTQVTSAATSALLGGKANVGVVYAAISRDHKNVAFADRDAKDRWSLSLVTATGGPGAPVPVQLPAPADPAAQLGRPAWVPQADATDQAPQLLVPWGGQLFQVSANGDITQVPLPFPVAGDVTDVTVSPDGRRLALVVGGQLFITPLVVGKDTLKIDGQSDQIAVDPTFVATAVAWLSEEDLYLLGSGSGGTGSHPKPEPQLWRVSSDGVIVANVSISTAEGSDILYGLDPVDLVAPPNGAFGNTENTGDNRYRAILVSRTGSSGQATFQPYRLVDDPSVVAVAVVKEDGTNQPFFVV